MDLTDFFQNASASHAPWAYSDVERMVEAVAKHHPDCQLDWEPPDEEWARVLASGGPGVIALICVRLPIGFIRNDSPLPDGAGEFVWFPVASFDEDSSYRVDPTVLERVFGRAMSNVLNWNAVSIMDVWWATVT